MTARATRVATTAACVALSGLLGACGSSSTASGESAAAASTEQVAASSAAASTAVGSSPAASSAPASSAAPAPVDMADPCALLDPDVIAAASGVQMPAGVPRVEEARQVEMCTWTSSDPIAIVATGVTKVGAEEAFTTNRDLSPAYFDGDAVEQPLESADKAYVVKVGEDGGWVVGAIAKGVFIQVQITGDGMTQQVAEDLTKQMIARLP